MSNTTATTTETTANEKTAMGLRSMLTIIEVMSFEDLIDKLQNHWLVTIGMKNGDYIAFLKLEEDDTVRIYSHDGKPTSMTITEDMTIFDNEETEVYAFKKKIAYKNVHLFKSTATVEFINQVAGLPVMAD